MPNSKGSNLQIAEEPSDVPLGSVGWSAPQMVLLAAVLFNGGLAIINAKVMPLTPGIVITCEAVLTTAAAVLGLMAKIPQQRQWIAFSGLMVGFAITNGLGSGGFDPKFMRDVLIIPVFVLLGMTCHRSDLIKVLIPLQAIVLAFMIFEVVRPEAFGHLFNVMSYYIQTRGFRSEDFWNAQSDLFISATRPGDRFLFNSLNIHRMSSVFLEPVSLGNYCVLVALITAALWASLSFAQRVFLCASDALILIGCDGRFATVCVGFMIILSVVAPRLPRFVNWFYLPGILALSAVAVAVFALRPFGDDFPGRTAGSIAALSQMSLTDLFGYSTRRSATMMDSGIAYLLYSQSLMGAVVIWTFVALGLRQSDRSSLIMAHGVSLYVASNLLVSSSMFSIKTAALLWFSYGTFAREASQASHSFLSALGRGRRSTAPDVLAAGSAQ